MKIPYQKVAGFLKCRHVRSEHESLKSVKHLLREVCEVQKRELTRFMRGASVRFNMFFFCLSFKPKSFEEIGSIYLFNDKSIAAMFFFTKVLVIFINILGN